MTAAPSFGEWRDIKSAPRDGTEFLICRFGKESIPSYNVVYFEQRGRSVHCWQFVDGGGAYHKDFPTHWMPLPSPPTPPQAVAKAREGIVDHIRKMQILREHAGKSVLENLEITRDAIAESVSDLDLNAIRALRQEEGTKS